MMKSSCTPVDRHTFVRKDWADENLGVFIFRNMKALISMNYKSN